MAFKKLSTAQKKMNKSKEAFKKSIAAIAGLDNTTEIIKKSIKTNNVLIVRIHSYSVGTMTATLLGASFGAGGNGQYQVVTKDGVEIFSSDIETTFLSDRDILTVYDTSNGKRKIGSVKQWLISGGIPLFEKEAKTCTVTLEKDKLCDLKKCISFGDLQIETLGGSAEIKIKSKDNYSILYNRKKIAELHELPMKLKDGFVDKYVLEYKEAKDIPIAVMMTIALDVVNG